MSKKQNKKHGKRKKRKNSDYHASQRNQEVKKTREKSIQDKVKDANIVLSVVLVICAIGLTVIKSPAINKALMSLLFIVLFLQQLLLMYAGYKEKSKSKVILSIVVMIAFGYLGYKVFTV